MNKIKILHIHSDPKFIENSNNLFKGERFSNTLIFIGSKLDSEKMLANSGISVFNKSKENFREIVSRCKVADFIVLYGLDGYKAKISLSLPKSLNIAWYFFGYELYKRKPKIFISRRTLNVEFKKDKIKERIKWLFRPFYNYLKFGYKDLFISALKRIDYLFILSDEEYDFLLQYWSSLPTKIKRPHRDFIGLDLPDFMAKQKVDKPLIILGHSRSLFNNHLDMINLVESSVNKYKYNFTLLFNYGFENIYTQKVRECIQDKPYYSLIEEFMSPNAYCDFYKRSTALVIDAYRQIAIANIFSAFCNGVKVYMNDKNVSKKWLINEGFKVFSMEDFKYDLEHDNLYPDIEAGLYNFTYLQIFAQRYNFDDFEKTIIRRVAN